ncbi:MAG: hypothetical protein WC472_00980 [Candidatus Paceibacterota bacterium]
MTEVLTDEDIRNLTQKFTLDDIRIIKKERATRKLLARFMALAASKKYMFYVAKDIALTGMLKINGVPERIAYFGEPLRLWNDVKTRINACQSKDELGKLYIILFMAMCRIENEIENNPHMQIVINSLLGH